MYRRVLVPTDGSSTAERAVDHAISLASEFDAELHAVFVVDEGMIRSPLTEAAVDWDQVMTGIEDKGRGIAQAAADGAASRGVTAKGIVRRAETVAEGILEHAEESDVDLIVMGTHGRTGLKRVLLGSVAESVLRRTGVPVMMVPPGEG